jgi:hypothetical protein
MSGEVKEVDEVKEVSEVEEEVGEVEEVEEVEEVGGMDEVGGGGSRHGKWCHGSRRTSGPGTGARLGDSNLVAPERHSPMAFEVTW